MHRRVCGGLRSAACVRAARGPCRCTVHGGVPRALDHRPGAGAGLGWSVVRARASDRRSRARQELGEAPPPGSLRAVLAEATRRSVAPGRLLAAAEPALCRFPRPTDDLPPHGAGRSRNADRARTRPVAVVLHTTRRALEPVELLRAIGAAARLAVENERLAAQTWCVRELIESRARIVDRDDRERRRLERDLHDGAQQRLLTLSYRLRVAARRPSRAAAPTSSRRWSARPIRRSTSSAGLRELAHGIYPAVLREAGLRCGAGDTGRRAPRSRSRSAKSTIALPAGVETAA